MAAGGEAQKSDADAMLEAFHEHEITAPIDEIARLIQPDAEMRLLVSFGAVLRGREAVLAALERGREAAIYLAQVDRIEWLDDRTALIFGRARYPLEGGGHAQSSVYWLDELRDGLIFRVQAFKSEDEARRAYEERFEERLGSESSEPSSS